ncbi:hypothetical protein [Carboxylicivirga sp. N1Y90]|uniref:hypothetical protein n=1 Tax=Carboxylicivirga fragile TaxID=3417571 RepID=UPI003D338BC2|nr:hypothetical protein [Marinilabiliaceae bacterium N1Y90]
MKTNVQQPTTTAYAEDETLIHLSNIYSRHKHIKVGDKMMLLMDKTSPTPVQIKRIQINGRIVYFDLIDLEACQEILVAIDLDSDPYFTMMNLDYVWDLLVENTDDKTQ